MTEELQTIITYIVGSGWFLALLSISLKFLWDRYRNKTGYIKEQYQAIVSLYYLLFNLDEDAFHDSCFKDLESCRQDINHLVKNKAHVFPQSIWNSWSKLHTTVQDFSQTNKAKERSKKKPEMRLKICSLLKHIENVANKDVIPKYRKIVGQSIPLLKRENIPELLPLLEESV